LNAQADHGREFNGLMQARRYADLEARAREIIGLAPESGLAWKALGVALAMQGKDEIQALGRAADLLPSDGQTHLNLGDALRRRGAFEDAISRYRRAIQLNPHYVEAWHGLGNAQLALGRFDEAAASYRRVIALNPKIAQAHGNLGNALRGLGRPDEAVASYARALALEPEFAAAHSNLSDALRDLGQPERALESCRRALAIAPDVAGTHNSLGNALLDLGRIDEAAASYARAVALDARFVKAHVNLAMALRLQGSAADAEVQCRKALEIDACAAPAMVLLAELHTDRGSFADAGHLLQRAVEVDPDMAEAWAGMAHLRKMTDGDGAWLAQAQRVAGSSLSPRQEIHLRFALGKFYDDVGDYDQAFASYHRANELARQLHGNRTAPITPRIDRIIQTYDAAWARKPRARMTGSERAVFIVGMPRSGTTLAEQILASHPQVFGAGELPFWGDAAGAEAAPESGEDAEGSIAALGERYLQLLDQLSSGAARVVDKMPANFLALGLIHSALPQARVIHMRRDPRDTCLSIYFQHFKTGITYANDLGDLAMHYRQYQRLMEHWRQVLPASALLEVPYEELVADQEGWSRRMVEFIGLPWDAACLDFHRMERSVMTASKWQVRQRISSASVGRWRHYLEFLGPLAGLAQT
jgi:tetratricopeptide (TPR) repeat protein